MEMLGRQEIELLLILDLGTKLDEWSVSWPSHTLPPRKWLLVPTGDEAGWAPELAWMQRLEEKSFAPVMDQTPAGQSVVIKNIDWTITAHNLNNPGWKICKQALHGVINSLYKCMQQMWSHVTMGTMQWALHASLDIFSIAQWGCHAVTITYEDAPHDTNHHMFILKQT
jgi:hypothetical protein